MRLVLNANAGFTVEHKTRMQIHKHAKGQEIYKQTEVKGKWET